MLSIENRVQNYIDVNHFIYLQKQREIVGKKIYQSECFIFIVVFWKTLKNVNMFYLYDSKLLLLTEKDTVIF